MQGRTLRDAPRAVSAARRFRMEELQQVYMAGWIWRLRKSVAFPIGLRLFSDRPGHSMLVPTHDMPLDHYRMLLGRLASCFDKVGMK